MPRSIKKGPFIDNHLWKKIDNAIQKNDKKVIKTSLHQIKVWLKRRQDRVRLKAIMEELAKEFGGTDGHKYVNGVLNGLAPSLRAAEVEADKAKKPRKA